MRLANHSQIVGDWAPFPRQSSQLGLISEALPPVASYLAVLGRRRGRERAVLLVHLAGLEAVVTHARHPHRPNRARARRRRRTC
jgi:hypothetical protein